MMRSALGISVSIVFAALALWHFYMALSPGAFVDSAVPSLDGKPMFTPRRLPTVAVGVVLLLFAMLVAAAAGVIATPVPKSLLSLVPYALATGLLGRAIGEFRYVGFFKRVRGTQFAHLDTWLYSPLCLLLAIAIALMSWLSLSVRV
jgi:hypothetical protein